MRLRQLARKLGVQPDTILRVLSENGHELENDANSKLSAEQLSILEGHFAVETETSQSEEDDKQTLTAHTLPDDSHVSTPLPVAEVSQTPEAADEKEPELKGFEVPFGPPSHATSQVSDEPDERTLPEKIQLEPKVKVYKAYEEDESYAQAELIETEKPKLDGLKVVGKIELPEPKKPEPKAKAGTEEEEESAQRAQHGRHGRGKGQRGRNHRQRMNPVEYERKKAERLAKKKKAEQEKRLKEKKKKHYLATVKAKTQAPKVKKKAVEKEETIAPLPINGMSRPEPHKTKPKRPKKGLKWLWAWLNGEYDKF